MSPTASRRRQALLLGAACLAAPALASSRRVTAAMTEGPFYPPARWREQGNDWDADLTRVQRRGVSALARGEHLLLGLAVVDTRGRAVDGAEVEIWQCDALAAYRHPLVAQAVGNFDPGFQGFGSARSAADGTLQFRTIRPVPYPGRTPHVHLKLRHASFGELTTQLFVAGEPANERDFLWRRLDEPARAGLSVRLSPAAGDADYRWLARHALTLPA